MIAAFCAAAICALSGMVLGPYVDNETPERCQSVIALLANQSDPVYYGVGQGEPGFHCKAGGVKLQEWFPFWNGADQLGPPPCGSPGFIIQWNFAWDSPPTVTQRNKLLSQTRACNPELIVKY